MFIIVKTSSFVLKLNTRTLKFCVLKLQATLLQFEEQYAARSLYPTNGAIIEYCDFSEQWVFSAQGFSYPGNDFVLTFTRVGFLRIRATNLVWISPERRAFLRL
jgi:hypothetical protein